ncbi:MAG TPA: ABC transporter permease [Candidatus Acidoferrales bacterium]|nr:ABC transporter permease [Candidatus Acidoferrales bacterium]
MNALRRMFSRRRLYSDLSAEIAGHLQEKIDELVASGISREEATRMARREFGNVTLLEERGREVWQWPSMESFFADVRFGLRMLRKSPGFTVVAVLTLALGIGANTALFSVVNGVLLNPLPYPNSDRLVTVDASKPQFKRGSISYPNFLDWHRLNQCFSYFSVSRGTGFMLTGAGAPEELDAVAVTSDFFAMLGVKPILGRSFTPEEDQIGMGHVVAISADLWRRKFSASRDIIGKEISLDGKGYTVVGIFPGHFDLPMYYFGQTDAYIPLGEFANPVLSNRVAGLGIHGIARLKPGVTIEQARADMQRVTNYLAQVYPEADKDMGTALTPLKETIVGKVRGFLLLLLGAVGFVLLIACVNVANLLLARGNTRSREIAVRSALGAGTSRLIRQMLTESVLLAAVGGALGLAFAAAGTRATLAALPSTLPRANEVGMDAHVLWFTIVISLCAGVFFGLLPAIRTARHSTYEALKEGGRSVSPSRRHAQGALVVVQMALALVLLAGAGLLIRSLSQLWKIDPGFDPNHIITFNLALPPQMNRASPAAIRAALHNFDAAIAAVPGVEGESLSWGAFPMYSEDDQNFWLADQPRPASEGQMYNMLDYIVGPDYLEVMHIPLLAGRFFTASDNENSKAVVVIDEVLAKKYFPNGDAVGKIIDQGDATHTFPFEIVGVVGHVKQWGLDTDSQNSLRAQLYFPFMQLGDNVISVVPSNSNVIVRATGDLLGLTDAIRAASNRLSKDEVLTNFETMHEIIESSLAPRRFAMMLLGAFAAVALALAGIGLYGVIAYAVGQRTHEIGIRIALGAHPRDVFRLVVGQGLRLAIAGVFIGAAAALILIRVLSSFSQLLYGIGGSDPVTLIAVAAVLLAVAFLACYIPARRAMRVDPMVALRYE